MADTTEIFTHEAILARIAQIPRVTLACLPTPIHEAQRLSSVLDGPRIFIKRDDLTGVAFGGNKTRNLEFRMAAARDLNADVIIVELDVQSNSARQTVGCANKLGMDTILVLQGELPSSVQGNLLVDYLLGADIHFAPTRETQRQTTLAAADEVRAKGRTPCILTDLPMFDEVSAIAYIESTMEIMEGLEVKGLTPTCLYMSSFGKGQAGQLMARSLFSASFDVRGVTATDEFNVPPRTVEIVRRTARRLGLDVTVSPDEVSNDDGFVGPGYGIPSEEGNEAVRLFARTEGVILDPIYTGKAAAAMVADIRGGKFKKSDIVVFVHTGGTPAMFTYSGLWLDVS